MAIPKKYKGIGFKPPKAAQKAGCRALEIRKGLPKSRKGMTAVGVSRANQLCKGKTLSPSIVRRMAAFERHRQNSRCKDGSSTCKGRQAWLGWGGDSGIAWAKRVVKQMNKRDGKSR